MGIRSSLQTTFSSESFRHFRPSPTIHSWGVSHDRKRKSTSSLWVQSTFPSSSISSLKHGRIVLLTPIRMYARYGNGWFRWELKRVPYTPSGHRWWLGVGSSWPWNGGRDSVCPTWKVRRSLLGLSLMSSMGVLVIITSVMSLLGTNTGLQETGDTEG